MTRPAVAAALLLAAAACAPQPKPGSGAPGTRSEVVGTVRVAGSAPMNTQVLVRPDAGVEVRVEGPLAAEVRRLSGARVAVRGPLRENAVTAESYEVVSVDGQPVHLGVVERPASGGVFLRLADGARLELRGPAAVEFRTGQKVWVQGPGSVSVQTFGIVSP